MTNNIPMIKTNEAHEHDLETRTYHVCDAVYDS
jgi:hypothetical protein